MKSHDALIAAAALHSQYLKRQLNARAWLAPRLGEVLDRPLTREDMQAFLAETPLTADTLGARLRQLRAYVYAHVMVRDLAGLAPLPEVMNAMSVLAEVAVDTGVDALTAQLAERHGLPRNAAGEVQPLIVIGMGKLGGGELNVSSDIDLIYVYPEDGETDGPRPISAFDFHTRLGRNLIGLLAEQTAEGYVFRVDMRLRPNGDSGPLVANFEMLENYFISQGREWERYAWIKARPLTGSQHAEMKNIARPFIFRKYLDFGAINAMRGLHAQIRQEVARRDRADNIKLGPGGIREIEFIAQVFQLIRGGRDASLQIRPTLRVLDKLSQVGILPDETVAELAAAYDFLRRLEHRIQYLEDAQTHMIPPGEAERAKLAQAMGFEHYEALHAALDAHRRVVSRHFDAVFSDPAAEQHKLTPMWNSAGEIESAHQCLAQLGFQEAEASSQRLQAFRSGARLRSLGEESRARLDALMPRVLELAAARPNPDATLTRSIDLLEAICRRAAYLALLQQYPQALARVVELISASSWAAAYLTRHPLLLDELLDSRSKPDSLVLAELAAQAADELRSQMDALGEDTERQMDVMREFHHTRVFRLLTRDLAGLLSVEALSDCLSALADIVLEETLRQCWQKLGKRHAAQHRFAILGYGKLGGKELGYASDLDLVFVHDDPDPDCQPIYARLGQRICTWLDSHTPAGHLFETDMRLRPNGDSGLIVISLEAFEKYQRENAWVWEHQALTRARFCAGNHEVGQKFERLRDELLREPREVTKLHDEVLAMRRKMSDAFADKGAGFELKHDAGGLIDVEFIVQYLVLAHAHQWPELTGNIGNIALLKLAANVGLIPADLAHAAADAYRELRRAQHALRLNQHKSRVGDDGLQAQRDAVNALWQVVFGPRR